MLKDMKSFVNVHKTVVPPKEMQKDEEEEEKSHTSKRRLSIRELKSAR